MITKIKEVPGPLADADFPDFYYKTMRRIEDNIYSRSELLKKICMNPINMTNYLSRYFLELEDIIGSKKLTPSEIKNEMHIFAAWYISKCDVPNYYQDMHKMFLEKSELRNPNKVESSTNNDTIT